MIHRKAEISQPSYKQWHSETITILKAQPDEGDRRSKGITLGKALLHDFHKKEGIQKYQYVKDRCTILTNARLFVKAMKYHQHSIFFMRFLDFFLHICFWFPLQYVLLAGCYLPSSVSLCSWLLFVFFVMTFLIVSCFLWSSSLFILLTL